jgi:metal-dependent amidase/aminoacylase/carboxypeptidase family protein
MRYIAFLMLFLVPATLVAAPPYCIAPQESGHLLEKYWTYHEHPELPLHEARTAARLAATWKFYGVDVTTHVGGNGIVGVMARGNGPVVMICFPLDASPIEEKTGVDYASKARMKDASGQEVGVMHACGNDLGIACSLGLANYLAPPEDSPDEPKLSPGTLILVGQPASQSGQGAKAMLDDGLFTRFPKPDYILAMHADPNLPTGTIGVSESALLTKQGKVATKNLPASNTPGFKNDSKLVERLVPYMQKLFGEKNVVLCQPPQQCGDFATYAQTGVPVCMFSVGTTEPRRLASLKQAGKLPAQLNSAQYLADAEPAITVGFDALLISTMTLVNPKLPDTYLFASPGSWRYINEHGNPAESPQK